MTARDYLAEVLGGYDFVPDTEEEAVRLLIESHRRQWEIIQEMPIIASPWWSQIIASLKMRWACGRRWFR